MFSYTDRSVCAKNLVELLSLISNRSATVDFLDLEKAFELAWIRDYLSQHQARVRFQGIESDYKQFDIGTPQRGILSPTL